MSKKFVILDPDPDAIVEGKSFSEWTKEWWKWVGERSIDENPLDDPTGEYASLGNDGEVFFVAGPRVVTIDPDSKPNVVDDGIVERKFHVPVDKPLLVPIMNVLSFDPENDPLSFYMERFEGLYATIDGKKIEGIEKYTLGPSDCFKLGDAKPGTVLYDLITNDPAAGDPEAKYCAATDGYWLMLDDLSRGRHTLEFGGFYDGGDVPNGEFNPDDGDVRMAAKLKINVVGPDKYNCPIDADILPEVEMCSDMLVV